MRILRLSEQKKYTYVIFAVILFSIIGMLSYYRWVYLPSPTHSVQLITRAIQSKDEKTFRKMVDVPNLCSEFYDGLVAHHNLSTDNPAELTNNQFMSFINYTMKSNFVPTMESVITGTISGKTNTSEFKQQQQSLNSQIQYFNTIFTLQNWQFKSVSRTNIEDGQANVDVIIHNSYLNTNLTITLIMVPLDENHWHVIGFSNLEGFFQAIDKAATARLIEYNRPTQDKINTLVTVDMVDPLKISTDLSSPSTRLLKIPYRLALHTKGSTIATVYGRYHLSEKTNKQIFTGEFSLQNIPEKSGFLPGTAQFLLNPIFPSQKRLIEEKNIGTYVSSIEIYRIDFKNGTVLQTLSQLPSQED